MNKALITGISGQDGSYLTKFLLSKNYEVIGLVSDDSQNKSFENFKKLNVSEKDITKISLADLEKFNFNDLEIYNLAGQSSVGQSWTDPVITFVVNVNLYVKILQFCKGKNVKVFQASSGEMYGEKGSVLLSEEMEMKPQNPYALSKYTSFLYGRMLREKENMFITNGILFNHESPLRDPRFVTRKIIDGASAIKDGVADKLELGNIDIKRDWGFAEDYVEAMWKIMQLDTPIDVNIASGCTISLRDYISYVFKYFGINDYEKYIKINSDFVRKGDISELYADVNKLNKLGIILECITENNINRLF